MYGLAVTWYPDTVIYMDRPGVWGRPLEAGTALGIWAVLSHISVREEKKRERSMLPSEHRGSAGTPRTGMCSRMYMQAGQRVPPTCHQECQSALEDQVSGPKTLVRTEWRVRLEAHPGSRNLCMLPETGTNDPSIQAMSPWPQKASRGLCPELGV